jgi:hypothetical protein
MHSSQWSFRVRKDHLVILTLVAHVATFVWISQEIFKKDVVMREGRNVMCYLTAVIER